MASLSEGEISFDKLRAVSDMATPETDRDVLERARECSVRQLVELAARRSEGGAGEAHHERRFVRFNDRHRTVTAQLPAESYVEVRSCLEGRARKIPSDGETPGTGACATL